MNILTDYTSSEFTVKGSRFLSELFPCESQAMAKDIIKAQKAKYPDATHVVHAFVLGLSSEILGMSDDGEPSGTAGRPALDVLKGYGCTNVLLTITRWFGGTLLGTGGLVKAYGDGAKQVLHAATDAGLFEEYVKKYLVSKEEVEEALGVVSLVTSSNNIIEFDQAVNELMEQDGNYGKITKIVDEWKDEYIKYSKI